MIVLKALEKSINRALTVFLAFESRCAVTVSINDMRASSVDLWGLYANWVGSSSNGATLFITKRSKHFPTIEVRAIGRKSLGSDAPVNLGIGLILAVFQTWGITPCCSIY